MGKINIPAAKKEIHAALKENLPFPEYYGANLDALYDVLVEPHEPWEITFVNTRRLWQEESLYMRSLKETFDDASADGANMKVEWQV